MRLVRYEWPLEPHISARLYDGDLAQRLRQEFVLGIGGVEALENLGIRHLSLHLNEGHAAFSLLEQVRDRVNQGVRYSDALTWVKETSIFTTHTPVPS
jgi:starch phosphorylase